MSTCTELNDAPTALTQRSEYMAALEQASTNHDIEPFTQLLASLLGAP